MQAPARRRREAQTQRGIESPPESISIRRLFRERSPRLAKRLPPGTLRLFEILAHQRTINARIHGGRNLDPFEFCDWILRSFGISVTIKDEHLLRAASRPVICANHPAGGVEGIALISVIGRIFGACRFPANDLLRLVRPLAPLIVPVRHGNLSRQAAKTHAEVYSGNSPILVFPAGVTARPKAGVLCELPWRVSFVTAARRSERPLVPAAVSGRNSARFYRIYALRRALGIQLNIEMMLLVDELFRRRNGRITIRFLPHRDVQGNGAEASPREADRRVAEQIRREVEDAAHELRREEEHLLSGRSR